MNCGQGAERFNFCVQALGNQGSEAAALWRWVHGGNVGTLRKDFMEPSWEEGS